MLKRFALAATFLVSLSSLSHAEYPYTGYFTAFYQRATPNDVLLGCAIHSFVQQEDGRSHDYILDVEHYKATKKIRYARSFDSECTFVESHQTEFCHATENDQSGSHSYDLTNYIADIEVDEFHSIMFSDMAEYNRFFSYDERKFDADKYKSASLVYA